MSQNRNNIKYFDSFTDVFRLSITERLMNMNLFLPAKTLAAAGHSAKLLLIGLNYVN